MKLAKHLLVRTVLTSPWLRRCLVQQRSAQSPCCGQQCQEYRLLLQHGLNEQRQMTAYRLETRTAYEERPVTTYRPVMETQMRERRYTVARPVFETSEREDAIVARPVMERHRRPQLRQWARRAGNRRARDATWWPGPSTKRRMRRADHRSAALSANDQRTRRTIQRHGAGHDLSGHAGRPGRLRRSDHLPARRRAQASGLAVVACVVDPATGQTAISAGAWLWVPMQAPSVYQVARVWQPNVVTVQVPQTSLMPRTVARRMPVQTVRMVNNNVVKCR